MPLLAASEGLKAADAQPFAGGTTRPDGCHQEARLVGPSDCYFFIRQGHRGLQKPITEEPHAGVEKMSFASAKYGFFEGVLSRKVLFPIFLSKGKNK